MFWPLWQTLPIIRQSCSDNMFKIWVVPCNCRCCSFRENMDGSTNPVAQLTLSSPARDGTLVVFGSSSRVLTSRTIAPVYMSTFSSWFKEIVSITWRQPRVLTICNTDSDSLHTHNLPSVLGRASLNLTSIRIVPRSTTLKCDPPHCMVWTRIVTSNRVAVLKIVLIYIYSTIFTDLICRRKMKTTCHTRTNFEIRLIDVALLLCPYVYWAITARFRIFTLLYATRHNELLPSPRRRACNVTMTFLFSNVMFSRRCHVLKQFLVNWIIYVKRVNSVCFRTIYIECWNL